jgi:hypothetical protein
MKGETPLFPVTPGECQFLEAWTLKLSQAST